MSEYFVDPVNGSDTTGTGSISAPWVSINKAIGSTPAITMSGSGDTVWLIPSGPYRDRNVAIGLNPGLGNVLTIAGDYDGSAQRRNGASTIYTGSPVWTAYKTSDTTYPSDSNAPLVLNGKSYVTLQNLAFIGNKGSTASCINALTAGSSHITLKQCTFNASLGFQSGSPCIGWTTAADAANMNWLIDSCTFFGPIGLTLTLTTSATAQYNINSTIQNCLMLTSGTAAIYVVGSGTGFNGYGLLAQNNTIVGGRGIYSALLAGTSSSGNYQVTAYNNVCFGNAASFACSDATHNYMLGDYNVLYGALTNYTEGAHGFTTSGSTAPSPSMHLGEERLAGMSGRPFLMPWAGSPLLGIGGGGTPLTYDLLGRARPEGGLSATPAAGCLERHDTGARTTTYAQSGSNSLKIAGPGSHEFKVAVPASATAITVYALYDSNYGAGTLPSAQILANGEIGVAQQGPTVMSAAGAGTWAQISLGPFTPTAAGVVTLRLTSAAAAGGIAYFDTANVPSLDTSSFDYYNRGEPLPVLDASKGGGISFLVSGGLVR